MANCRRHRNYLGAVWLLVGIVGVARPNLVWIEISTRAGRAHVDPGGALRPFELRGTRGGLPNFDALRMAPVIARRLWNFHVGCHIRQPKHIALPRWLRRVSLCGFRAGFLFLSFESLPLLAFLFQVAARLIVCSSLSRCRHDRLLNVGKRQGTSCKALAGPQVLNPRPNPPRRCRATQRFDFSGVRNYVARLRDVPRRTRVAT